MKLLTLAAVIAAAGALTNPLQRIRKDYMALSVRASPRHVMRPRTDDGRRPDAARLRIAASGCVASKRGLRARTTSHKSAPFVTGDRSACTSPSSSPAPRPERPSLGGGST